MKMFLMNKKQIQDSSPVILVDLQDPFISGVALGSLPWSAPPGQAAFPVRKTEGSKLCLGRFLLFFA